MLVFLLVVCIVLLSGILFSVPVTYGIAREFWKNQKKNIPYEELFGKLQLLIICLFGPIFALLMFLGVKQKGIGIHYAWPNRDDWERTTFSECSTVLTCDLPKNVLKEVDSVVQN
ncbi:MAG: hypothetical protein JKX80_00920 [Candidatus Pacebacteria bacterium]|nr:hypothetical protein [Candidatus Paceibacterota bacterium]